MMKHLCRALVILVLCGAAMADPQMQAKTADLPAGYKLQPGDILQVVVWKETDLQSEVLIRPDGGISFPLAGDLAAAG
ncbi:MAG TPA: polysaccharide biosynthesis/export family protein, partial [Steroidobacteraceae bacterium]|nr:polysaccharide biosynthesis/export family protein [Steroidobacteraceae bacterium]